MMPLKIEKTRQNVAILTLNRPERLNALNPDLVDKLINALHELSREPKVGAIVVTGAGRAFCAGGDVKLMGERSARGFEERVDDLRHAHKVPMLLRTIPKVTIAMINGPAMGAGLALAMACDLRFAARSAKLGTSFTNVALASDWGATWSLVRLVGSAKARELFFSGEVLEGDAAQTIGLVTRAIDDEALNAETIEMAERLAKGPLLAYGHLKRLLLAAETEPFQDVLDLEALVQARVGLSRDHEEAQKAFIEKRAPIFHGA